MATPGRTLLDPFRAVIGVITGSDMLVRAANAAGLRVDVALNEKEAYSPGTRVRALLPRILAAYDLLPDLDKLIEAQAVLGEMMTDPRLAERASATLARMC